MEKPLTPKQQELIQTLYFHTNVISEAAARVGIPAKVALNLMKLPYMRQAFMDARRKAITNLIEEAKAGKIDVAMGAAVLVAPQDLTSLKTSMELAGKFPTFDADAKAEVLQRWISELQASLNHPIEKLLIWR